MNQAYPQPSPPKIDWQDALSVALELGLPAPFNFEWMIDAAERGEWSGLWW